MMNNANPTNSFRWKDKAEAPLPVVLEEQNEAGTTDSLPEAFQQKTLQQGTECSFADSAPGPLRPSAPSAKSGHFMRQKTKSFPAQSSAGGLFFGGQPGAENLGTAKGGRERSNTLPPGSKDFFGKDDGDADDFFASHQMDGLQGFIRREPAELRVQPLATHNSTDDPCDKPPRMRQRTRSHPGKFAKQSSEEHFFFGKLGEQGSSRIGRNRAKTLSTLDLFEEEEHEETGGDFFAHDQENGLQGWVRGAQDHPVMIHEDRACSAEELALRAEVDCLGRKDHAEGVTTNSKNEIKCVNMSSGHIARKDTPRCRCAVM